MRTAVALAAALIACATAKEHSPAPAPQLDEKALSDSCARGFATDCRTLGRAHFAGEGTLARDDRLAAALAMTGCEMGDPAACSDLGVLYALGRGVPQNDERASALARRACEQGAAIACSNQGALLAEGAGRTQGEKDVEARIVRLFRKACDAGAAEGCTNLGTVLEAGKLTVRDVRASARAHRRACDAGFALACHRLALLLPERPDAAPDLNATALESRACRAGIAPACYAVSEAIPGVSSRTPAARLVDDRWAFAVGIPGTGGFSPGELAGVPASSGARSISDVKNPPQPLLAEVPAALHDRLGLALAPREAEPVDRPVGLLLALRRHQLGQCNDAPRATAARVEVFATFVVDRDGRPASVHAAGTPADSPLEECVASAVAGWEFPADPGGYYGPFVTRYEFEAPPAGPRPEIAGPGSLKPQLKDPTCVERALQLPPEYRRSTGSVTVKLAVDGSGKPGLVYALTPAPDAILSAVTAAVLGCAFEAGGDVDGRPAPRWMTLTVRLDAR